MKKLDKSFSIKPLPARFSAADTIKDTLNHYGITQAQFAKHLGVSTAYVSDVLNRKKFMSSEFALRVELVTGISAGLLLRMDLAYQLEEKKNSLAHKLDVKPFDWAVATA